jgi:hypothetical protein
VEDYYGPPYRRGKIALSHAKMNTDDLKSVFTLSEPYYFVFVVAVVTLP